MESEKFAWSLVNDVGLRTFEGVASLLKSEVYDFVGDTCTTRFTSFDS